MCDGCDGQWVRGMQMSIEHESVDCECPLEMRKGVVCDGERELYIETEMLTRWVKFFVYLL